MKALILALAAPFLAAGAGLEVSVPVPVRAIAHPVRAWKSLSVKTPSEKKLMAIADSLLMDANVTDYVTTRRGAFPGTHGCRGQSSRSYAGEIACATSFFSSALASR
jgi:hypothetical protein